MGKGVREGVRGEGGRVRGEGETFLWNGRYPLGCTKILWKCLLTCMVDLFKDIFSDLHNNPLEVPTDLWFSYELNKKSFSGLWLSGFWL